MIVYWFCYDDTLARLFETPALGQIPLWVWAIGAALDISRWTTLLMKLNRILKVTGA